MFYEKALVPTSFCAFNCACVGVRARACVRACVSACMCVCRLPAWLYVCMCVCVYVCAYVRIRLRLINLERTLHTQLQT